MIDLSVVIPALGEAANLRKLLPEVRGTLENIGVVFEILVVTAPTDDKTARAAVEQGARVIRQAQPGYAGALKAGFTEARGSKVMTMDADLSHPAEFITSLWRSRETGDILIASRYVSGGIAQMPITRYILSRVLNRVFSRGLALPVLDMSSGFRLYSRKVLLVDDYCSRHFDILQEILVRGYAEGWRLAEVPFEYRPRRHGKSHARVIAFGVAYTRAFWRLWKLRNSILCADYDARAYDSAIPLQRYWQRSRFRHVVDLIDSCGPVLDVGCGSSRIIGSLPPGSVALDPLQRKLRYARRFSRWLVCGSGFALPFADGSFPCLVCSQVIEHVPKDSGILEELDRVLAPGGRLILGTPDYAKWEWRWIERAYRWAAPGGYADEHIAHYTFKELVELFQGRGYHVEGHRYILNGELILALRKATSARPSKSH